MNRVECEFESEVLAAVVQSRWPDRAGKELLAHVQTCEICSDVAAVAGAIEESRNHVRASAALPESGRVWWLAQTRARHEAMQAAGRPITAVQVAAFGCAAGLLGACFGATSVWFQSALRWFGLATAGLHWKAFIPSAVALLAEHGVMIAALALMLLLVPVAVHLATARD